MHPSAVATVVPDPRIGSTLNDRYKITRKLGEGGMGLVYEGQHLLIQRRVAIKMLHAQFATNVEVVERFRREAIAATSIRHPHIVEVIDMGTAPDGAAYMVLEFLDGRDWSDDIEKTGPQPLGKVVRIMRMICDGLQAAHDNRIVHRDLKAENVYLAKHGADRDYVKIVDFGISKMLDEAQEQEKNHSLTKTGAAMGTPYSMAPEQMKGAKDVDHRADIWALGIMFYRALTGYYPFDAETFPMLAVSVLTADPAPLSTYRSDLPPQIQPIVSRLLAKAKEQRFQSATELREALSPFETVTTAPVTVTHPSGMALAATITPATPATAVGMPPTAPMPPTALAQATPTPALTSPIAPPAAITPAMVPGYTTMPLGTSAVGAPPSAGRSGIALGAVGAIVLLALGVGVGTMVMGGGSNTTTTATLASPPASEGPAEAPGGASLEAEAPASVPTSPLPTSPIGPAVRVQITTEPADAELFLDGQPIPSPFDGDLPSGTELHRIEARATGYVTETREVSLAFPQRLRIELVREGRRPSGERPRGEPTAHEEPARTEPTATVRPEPAIEAPPTEPAHEAPPADPPSTRPGLSNPFGRR